MGKIGYYYLIAVNLFAFIVYGVDKYYAKKRLHRVPEKVLFLLAGIGGSIGSLCGMFFFHHKTRHKSFLLGIPAILVLQMIAFLWKIL